MIRNVVACAAVLMTAASLPVSAHTLLSPWSVSSGIGTSGLYLGAQYRESKEWTTDADVSGFVIHHSFNAGGERYRLGARLLSGMLDEQWHPWSNGFYLDAGVWINGNRFSLHPSATNTGNYALATPASVSFHTVDPYVGLGYSLRLAEHSAWALNFAAGAAYQGSPEVYVQRGTGAYSGHAYTSEVSSLNNALGGFQWYPVVSIGVSYWFE